MKKVKEERRTVGSEVGDGEEEFFEKRLIRRGLDDASKERERFLCFQI